MTPGEEQFVEGMGRYFEADGVPRIGGRIYGYLLLRDEPLSLDDLARDLKVSKGSVSTNARLLVQWRLVERVTRPGDRRDYYTASSDLARILELRFARVRDMGALLQQGLAAVPEERSAAVVRLSRMAGLNARAEARMQELLDTVIAEDRR